MNRQQLEDNKFLKLIGTWKTEGRILPKDDEPEVNISGTDSYELILEGFYMLHKADVLMGENRAETFEIIHLQKVHHATFDYYNNLGQSGQMTGTLHDNRLVINGDSLRFDGRLNGDASQLSGTWQQLYGPGQWVDFMEMQLSRIA